MSVLFVLDNPISAGGPLASHLLLLTYQTALSANFHDAYLEKSVRSAIVQSPSSGHDMLKPRNLVRALQRTAGRATRKKQKKLVRDRRLRKLGHW